MKNKLMYNLAAFTLVLLIGVQVLAAEKHSYTPLSGYVPDDKTAVTIAKAIFIPIYGEDKIKSEQPFTATLANGVWTVKGTLPPHLKGGVAIAEISKKDGRIIRLSHGK